jgi:copper transport outer membrane protein MctB
VALDLLMINLRYHIVSLVAVFLALSIGVIAGTTVLNDQVVKGLKASDRTLKNTLNTQQDAIDGLQRELSLWEAFGASIEPGLVDGRLRGKKVVVLTANGVDGKLVGDIQDEIVRAGGSRVGSITFTNRWMLADDSVRRQLAIAIGASATDDASDLEKQAAQRLAQRFAVPGNPAAQGDLLQTLQKDGFLTVSDQTGGSFPPSGALLLWLSSGSVDPQPPDAQFTIPLLRGLAGVTPIAVGEPLASADSLTDQIRGDATLLQTVATIDHADTIPGRIALIAALRQIAAGGPAPHYGVRRGTSGIAPTPS